MDVNILDCSIKVQELYEKVSKCGLGSVSLFVGNRKEIFEKSVLGTVTGYSRNQVINAFLSEVCREVKEKHSVGNISIDCWLDASDHEPCLAIGCLASSYHQASEAVKAAVDLINGSRPKINCEDPVVDVVSADLIQVNASCEEINQRINSFIKRRREQVDKDNIRDFCCIKTASNKTSCARVNAVKIHRKDSKSHLRVRKVFNSWGPQTAQTAPLQESFSQLDDDHEAESSGRNEMSGNKRQKGRKIFTNSNDQREILLNERIRNVEEHIGFDASTSSDMYARLKKIEDKILYLEGVSPEYFQCCEKNSKHQESLPCKNNVKKSYSSADILKKIKDLECNSSLGTE